MANKTFHLYLFVEEKVYLRVCMSSYIAVLQSEKTQSKFLHLIWIMLAIVTC